MIWGPSTLFMGKRIYEKESIHWLILPKNFMVNPLKSVTIEIHVESAKLSTRRGLTENDAPLTYYWTFLSEKHAAQPITFYHPDPRRSGLAVQEFLGEYDGYVHCDMWSAYRQLPKAKLVGCWAHVRRKFFEATPKQADKQSLGARD